MPSVASYCLPNIDFEKSSKSKRSLHKAHLDSVDGFLLVNHAGTIGAQATERGVRSSVVEATETTATVENRSRARSEGCEDQRERWKRTNVIR